MKKTTTILLSLLILFGVPAQSDASTLFSRICQRVDAAFSNLKQNVKESVSDIKNEAVEVKETVSEKASNAKAKVIDKAVAVKEKVSDVASNVKEAAINVKDKVVNKFSDTKSSVVSASVATGEAVGSTVNASKNSVSKGIDKLKYKASYVKEKVSTVFHEGLTMARSAMQNAFNMSFLSSVPVVFWKKSFDKMTDHVQKSVDNMNLEYNGELVTRDDFQDDKALHIKKSAELALHLKSLFGSSIFAYGVTLVVGGVKELIDGSFLNPNGGRCWEDFYADIVGANAVFGEKAFNKKLNKYMDSFLKENRKVDMVNATDNTSDVIATATEDIADDVYEDNTYVSEPSNIVKTGSADSDSAADLALKKQLLTEAYYEAVKIGDTEAVKNISQQLQNLK